jgi:carbonic anhydrase
LFLHRVTLDSDIHPPPEVVIQEDTALKPHWAAEAFDDLATDVKQSVARIKASPFIPRTDQVRGFVFDVATGKLDDVV